MDPILYWNDVALEANRVSHSNGKGEQTGPPLSARALAIVHLAMYDAFAGASGNPPDLPPYLPLLPTAPPGSSVDAAVASAAYATLSALFPSQRLDFDASYASAVLAGTPTQVNDGISFGHTVARAILADRGADPGAGDAGYVPSTARPHHRSDPDNPGQPFHAASYGSKAKAFAVSAKHAIKPPPLPGDNDYRTALRQVRGKGIAPELMGTVPSNLSNCRRDHRRPVLGLRRRQRAGHAPAPLQPGRPQDRRGEEQHRCRERPAVRPGQHRPRRRRHLVLGAEVLPRPVAPGARHPRARPLDGPRRHARGQHRQ